jgi:ATP-dependent helicase/nuclease subunit A
MTKHDSAADPAGQATVIQHAAADPRRNAVLRASAGSGKTKVLVDRILRLALDGAPLKSIVALTFTRKAAVEIKERLLKSIRTLTVATTDERRAQLETLLGEAPSDAVLERSALLFTEILEDTNGLQIGTIHTFCQTLLSRFADYAGLDPAFTILERTDQLWEEAFQQLEQGLAADPGAGRRLSGLAKGPQEIRKKLDKLLHARLELDRWCDRVARAHGTTYDPTRSALLLPVLIQDLAAAMFRDTPLAGLGEPGTTVLAQLVEAAARDLATAGFPNLEDLPIAATNDTLAKKIAGFKTDLLAAADALQTSPDLPQAINDVFLVLMTGEMKPRKAKSRDAETQAAFEADIQPLWELVLMRDLLALYEHNKALLEFGLQTLDIYGNLKRRDRCLDFHDLEHLAWRLIHNQDVGPWVLYRMDQRLDHLLIDEFQDTNRNQWEILEGFAQEFLSARQEQARTVFFVGDVKQSIYGFRGAEPEIFSRVADWLAERTGQPTLTLPTNFRSSRAVVDAVGQAFQGELLASMLPSPEEAAAAAQICYRETKGRICIPPLFTPDEDLDQSAQASAAHNCVRLIRDIVASRSVETEPGQTRDAGYGDILLLSRSRTHIADYESALRGAGIPYVPAGRGALAQSREVKDILALLLWLTYPDDDIALISVLRSPLFRLDEPKIQVLMAGAAGQRQSLWHHLQSVLSDPDSLEIPRLLKRWLAADAVMNTHSLLRLIYRSSGALDAYGLAMGEQARFNLQRLHDLALAHDRRPYPTRRGFIEKIKRAALQSDEEEASLPETDTGRIRIMTIHGAKGLEAPFVILVDAGTEIRDKNEQLVLDDGLPEGPLVSSVQIKHRRLPEGLRPHPLARAARKALARNHREEANLLYVAMTRARDEFYALAAKPTQSDLKTSHFQWLEASDLASDCPDTASDGDMGLGADALQPTPATAVWTPGDLTPLIRIRFPSREIDQSHGDGQTAALADAEDGQAESLQTGGIERGILIHRLLQLAVESGTQPTGSDPEHQEVQAVLSNPELAWVFSAQGKGYCEIPILHQPQDRPDTRVMGVIDRLLVGEKEIRIIDYKSNRSDAQGLADLCETYRPQMAAYEAALGRIYPDHRIRSYLLFTHPEGPGGRGIVRELTPDQSA